MNTGFSKSNSRIENGSLANTSIDMNNKIITTHGTPVSGLDVVNKNYCDGNRGSSVPFFNITLSGVSWTSVFLTQQGLFDITVRNSMTGGPCAKFEVSKNDPSRNASIIRWNSCAGTTTEERLEIRWLPNNGIDIRKNKTGYDGTYTVKYIDSS